MAVVETVNLRKLCPTMSGEKRKMLEKAARERPLTTAGELDEIAIFDRKYEEIASFYVSDAAAASPKKMRAALDIFDEYKPVVEAVASAFLKSIEGSLVCDVAESPGRDVVMRPICEDTFGMVGTTKVGPYVKSYTAAGANHLIPSPDAHTAGVTQWTAGRKERTIVILGYIESVATSPVVSRVQETITDKVGDRKPIEVYMQQAMSDIPVIKRGSAEWVRDGEKLNIDVEVMSTDKTGFYPLGVEFVIVDKVTPITP